MAVTAFPKFVRIGTRGSELARWQAERVARRIESLGVAAEIVIVRTRGDVDQQTPVSRIGSKAIFIKELEDALLAGTIDLAVHSMKDLPVELPEGLVLAAVPERVSPLDAWVCPEGKPFEETPRGATIATGSLRRASQILARRPDLNIIPIRGNVPTRINKLSDIGAFATVLAASGLERLGLDGYVTEILGPDLMTPAMGQGALAIEARSGELGLLFDAIDDPQSRRAVEAERRFVAVLGGGCKTPVGILVEPQPAGWQIIAMLASADGKQIMRRTLFVSDSALRAEAESLAREMLAEAPREILATLEVTQ